jgi:hypothetical protein
MLSAIFGALAALPKFLDLAEKFLAYAEKLVSWIASQIEIAKRKKAEDDLRKAADKAKQEKDTSDLDKIFDPRK